MDPQLLQLAQLAVGGVPVALAVFVVTGVAKMVGLAKTSDQARWWNLGTAIIFGALALAVQLVPAWLPIVGAFVVAIIGSLGAALIYNLAQPLVDKLTGKPPAPDVPPATVITTTIVNPAAAAAPVVTTNVTTTPALVQHTSDSAPVAGAPSVPTDTAA